MSDDHESDEILELTEEMTAADGDAVGPPADEGAEDAPEDGAAQEEQSAPATDADDIEAPRRSKPPASPFTLLAKPRTEEERRESRASFVPADSDPEQRERRSFVPRQSAIPVIASPVMHLGQKADGAAPIDEAPSDAAADEPATEAVTADGAPAESTPPAEEEPGAETSPEPAAGAAAEQPPAEAEASPADPDPAADDDDEILDLGTEFVVAPEDAGEDLDAEPIPLVSASIPPPRPPVEEDSATTAEPAAEDAGAATEPIGDEAAAGEGGGAATADAPPDEEQEVAAEPTASAADDTASGGPISEPPPATEHPFDFGTPEMVFDAPEHAQLPDEEYEELDDDLLEEDEAGEGATPEESEEIDLAEAEDVTPETQPIPLPATARISRESKRPRMRRRRRPREWWSSIFDDAYLSLMPTFTKRDTRREVEFIQNALGVPSGALVLDLACGNGRHAIGMARRNYRVVGVDLSLSMLALAGELAQEAEQKINFIHGDMRDLGFNKTFDGIYCLGTSLGFFDEDTNSKVLEGVFRALKPGGTFLLGLANRDHVINKQPNLTWFERDGVVCMEETDFNYINSRLYVKRQLILQGGARQVKHEFTLRLYSLHEIGLLLHAAGFAVTKVSGHHATPGAFFGADSAMMFILATRRR